MKLIECFVLLGLIVATVSAKPGIFERIREAISGSSASARSHSVGGSIGLGLGPFAIGANLNSVHSEARSRAIGSSGYGTSDSHAQASASSEAHSFGFGLGSVLLGMKLNTAHSQAQSSTAVVNSNYAPTIYRPQYNGGYGL